MRSDQIARALVAGQGKQFITKSAVDADGMSALALMARNREARAMFDCRCNALDRRWLNERHIA